MKQKIYMKTSLCLLLMAFSLVSFAQPLSGSYTVGGVAPDYTSIGAAVNAMQLNGVSGPVVFNIRDGQYNEKIMMYQFAGSSPANTVTFQSENNDSSLVILSDSSSNITTSNFTVQIFGADNIIFNKMTIQRPGVFANGTVIEIGNTSNGISFTNNQIIAGSASGTAKTKCLIYTDSLNKNQDITITGNLFVNGNYGIYKQASGLETGNKINNNIFENQSGGAIYVDRQDSIIINRNLISANGSNNYVGIALKRSANAFTLNRNKISANIASQGLYFTECYSIPGAENTVLNNFISIGGTTVNTGVFIEKTSQLNLIYNSIHLTGTNAASKCIDFSGNFNSSLYSVNNVFAHSGGGYAIALTDTGALTISDYNDYFTTGSNVGSVNAINAALLVDLQTLTLNETNSVSADPVFISSSDLHASSVGINDLGIFQAGITKDIDNETRSVTNPDIGADEFTPLNDNVLLKEILFPVDYACGDSNTFVTVIVQNLGINPASAIPVTIEISGSTTATMNDTVFGPLSAYESDTLTLSGGWITYAGGTFTLKCYTSLTGDQDPLNDTVVNVYTITGIPDVPLATSPQSFCEGDINISAQTDSGNVLFWYDQPAGGNLIFTGNPFSPGITSDSTFYVEAHSGTGSTGCLRITEVALGDPAPVNADFIEIQNCSAAPVDVTGWIVVVSDDYSNINLFNATFWDLSPLGSIAPGQTEYRTDGGTNYWGTNIFWNPGSGGWAMIIDNLGNVVDYVSCYWTAADIQSFNATINGFPITIGGNWNGDGFTATCNDAIARIGSSDNDDATDFTCLPSSAGSLNSGLSVPFPSCGASICGSNRIPVEVIINPLPVVDLGPDTTSALPVTFDAGAGFTSYLWSNSATTQTISASATGVYAVVVTDINGCTATDTVNYTSTVGIDPLNTPDQINIYPNPAHHLVTVSFASVKSQTITINIQNLLGETLISETRVIPAGSFKMDFTIEHLSPGIYNLELLTQSGISNKKIVVK